MKKTMKRLALAKETMRSLETSLLPEVGGATANVCYPTFYNSACRFCLDEPLGPPVPA
jgi:hypothetical protein